MKKDIPFVLWIILTVVFASDVYFAESLVMKICRGILAVVCAIACYGEYLNLKNKK